MRIISNFHDYYDSFSDKESYTIYNRQGKQFTGSAREPIQSLLPEIITGQSKFFKKHSYNKDNKIPSLLFPFYHPKKLTAVPFTSGSFFHVVVGNQVFAGIQTYNVEEGFQYLYTVEDIMQVFEKHPQLSKTLFLKKLDMKHIREEAEEFFRPEIKNAVEVCRFYKSPLLLLAKTIHSSLMNLYVNPPLKEYNFQRVKDPFTLFQDISQFYETFLVTEKEVPVTVSDKDKIKQHGFDLKTSFRNM